MRFQLIAAFALAHGSLSAQEKAAAPAGVLAPLVVTAPRGGFPEPLATSPRNVTALEVRELRRTARSMAEALTGLPSVLVQKTALGQSSPYLRGLTGYHNVLLVDGVRLNHAAMRSGPNQYWSTAELLGAERLELVRGPHGIKYGADAVGGVVSLRSAPPAFSPQGAQTSGNLFGRLSSAESSWTGRLGGQLATPEWFAQLSHVERSFGDVEGGCSVGEQTNTGYDVRGTNLRLARKLDADARLTFGLQRVFMDDVPRTHKTLDALTWKGLSQGSELWRLLDQERRLYYGRLSWENDGGLADAGSVTLSLHQHGQERKRMKTTGGVANNGDFQRFDLDDLAFSARFETDDPWGGRLAYGAELHRETLTSSGHNFDANQAFTSLRDQGPLAADATYSRYAFYLADSLEVAPGLTLEPGLRFSRVDVNAHKALDAGGNLVSFQRDYEELVGSLRLSKTLAADRFLYAGLSQGFRPPSLYDLTSADETSVKETPNFNLDAENFLQAEIGLRGASDTWDWNLAAYHTWLRNFIVRSPKETTGSKVVKANGDGNLLGLEIELGRNWSPTWRSELAFSWMDGEVDQLLRDDAAGSVSIDGGNYVPVRRAPDRLMPAQIHFLTRCAPPASPWWAEGRVLAVTDGDDLSLKDTRDASRIPADGTPAHMLISLRAGRSLGKNASVALAAENLGDVDYRVHGSGLNGPGRNFILSFDYGF